MRCKFAGSLTALVLVCFVASAGTAAAKSRSKGKAKAAAKAAPAPEKKKAAELMTDERAITKQMSWEDKVLGPNDKKAELAKIARASAITKAAAEKAAADKAAGLDVKEPAPVAPKPQAKSALNLPTLPDEEELKGNGARDKRRDISPKLGTEQASAPVPAAKPADDKFIDKLLNSDGPVKKKSGSKANDSALDELLAKETDKPPVKAKSRSGKADVVDSVLASAEKEGEKTVVQPKQPDWTKPDAPAPPPPAPTPVAIKPAPKKNTGVIQVIQGANYAATPVAAPSATSRRPAAVEAPSPTRQVAARPAGWKDPFADGGGQGRKSAAPAPTPPSAKKEGAAHPPGWRDPFADGPDHNKAKRAPTEVKRPSNDAPPPPAGKSDQWKDPFTENSGGARATVAVADGPQRKWDIAARRAPNPKAPAAAPASEGPTSRWGVLKKRVH